MPSLLCFRFTNDQVCKGQTKIDNFESSLSDWETPFYLPHKSSIYSILGVQMAPMDVTAFHSKKLINLAKRPLSYMISDNFRTNYTWI